MTEPDNQEPKIIVDSDWKDEARKEKEELDRETSEMPKPGELPEPSLLELVQMIVLQASVGLGGFQDPQTGQTVPTNLPIAKHYIDLLDLFVQKTGGNLEEQEKKQIEATLNELRMAFVQIANAAGAEQEKPQQS